MTHTGLSPYFSLSLTETCFFNVRIIAALAWCTQSKLVGLRSLYGLARCTIIVRKQGAGCLNSRRGLQRRLSSLSPPYSSRGNKGKSKREYSWTHARLGQHRTRAQARA